VSSSANTNNNQPLFSSALLGSARLRSVERCSSKRATSSAFLPCAPSPSLLSSYLISGTFFFFQPKESSSVNARTHEKSTTKMSCEGTKMSCDGLTLGKIIFGYTPRVVLPPQQPFPNATTEQVQRWGEDVSNDGLDAILAH
jgi:hypothetical protein